MTTCTMPYFVSPDDPSLDITVYMEVRHESKPGPNGSPYVATPWTLRDCIGSLWYNRYTYSWFYARNVLMSRFQRLHLTSATVIDEYIYNCYDTNTIWRDNPLHPKGEHITVEHWDRYDILADEEKLFVLDQRVKYCQDEMSKPKPKNNLGGSAFWSDQSAKLKDTLERIAALTGKAFTKLESTNLGVGPGQQLHLL